MSRKYLIVLFFLAFVGARHAVPLQGLPLLSDMAFADLYQQDGQPCPPECVTDSMEIVTWYPSPYNEYEELRLYPISESNSQCSSDNRGLMYYDSEEDKVKLCKGSAGFNNWEELGGGLPPGYQLITTLGESFFALKDGATANTSCLDSHAEARYNNGQFQVRASVGACDSGWITGTQASCQRSDQIVVYETLVSCVSSSNATISNVGLTLYGGISCSSPGSSNQCESIDYW